MGSWRFWAINATIAAAFIAVCIYMARIKPTDVDCGPGRISIVTIGAGRSVACVVGEWR